MIYSNCIYEKKFEIRYPERGDIENTRKVAGDMVHSLQKQTWERDEYRQEIILAAQGLIVMAELYAKFAGYEIENSMDVNLRLEKYRTKWLAPDLVRK